MENPFDFIYKELVSIKNAINELKESNPCIKKTDEDQIGGIALAERITGLARSSIYAKVSNREIPFFKRSGTKRLYFSSANLLQWIKEGKKQTKDEIINENQ
jgi:predicted DNA-binding transcriptional regulator AlpA